MKKNIYIWFLFLLLTKVSVSQGFNDTVIAIPEVNVAAQKLFTKEQAGVKIVRIDTLILMNKINASVSDILAQNTSVHIKDYGRGAMATASFRGTSATHTQVSWNGLKINSPMLGMVDFSLIPVYIVDDMSLQHGAASLSKQSGGIGGHIAIDNTADWTQTFSGKFYTAYGSFNTQDIFGQVNFGSQNFQLKTRAYYTCSDNDYQFINKNKPQTDVPGGDIYFEKERNTHAEYGKTGLSQEFYWKKNAPWVVSSKIWYQNAFRSIPSVLSDESNQSGTEKINKQIDKTFKAVADAKYYKNNLKLIFRSGADYQHLNYASSRKNSGTDLVYLVNSGSKMRSWYNHGSARYNFSDDVSLEFLTDINRVNITTLDTVTHLGYHKKRWEAAHCVTMAYHPLKKLNTRIAIRKDWIANMQNPWVYSFGASYKPGTENFVFKTNISRNFHNPTLNDLYWQPGGNPNLKPETGYTFASGAHWIKTTEKWEINAEITGFYMLINDWILWLPNIKGYWEPMNLAQVASVGTEIYAKSTLLIKKTHLMINANYSFTQTENQKALIPGDENTTKTQLPYVPKHAANVFVSVENRGYYINLQYSFYGVRNMLSSNLETKYDDADYFGYNTFENPYYQLYPHHIKNISVGKKFKLSNSQLTTELKINNVFNEVYRNVLNRFMPGRNYYLSVKYTF